MKSNLPISIVLFLFSFISSSIAQDKYGIAITSVKKGAESISSADLALVQDALIKSFMEISYFDVVDRTAMDEVSAELEFQRTGNFIDSKSVVTQGKTQGANYIVVSSLLDYSLKTNTKFYKPKVSLQLKIVDVSSTKVVLSEVIDFEAKYDYKTSERILNGDIKEETANRRADKDGSEKDEGSAKKMLANMIKYKVRNSMDNHFNIKYDILKIVPKSPNKNQLSSLNINSSVVERNEQAGVGSIMINAGNNARLKIGEKVYVYVQELGNSVVSTPLGSLIIVDNIDNDVSLAIPFRSYENDFEGSNWTDNLGIELNVGEVLSDVTKSVGMTKTEKLKKDVQEVKSAFNFKKGIQTLKSNIKEVKDVIITDPVDSTKEADNNKVDPSDAQMLQILKSKQNSLYIKQIKK